MRILHRYVLQEMMPPFLLGVMVFTFVLLLTQIFRLADLIINRGVDAGVIARTLLCLLPPILALTVPMGLLLAVLLAFGRLSSDREIMAIRTSGIRLTMLYTPAVAIALLLTGLMLPVMMEVVPANRQALRELKDELAFQLVTSLAPVEMHRPDMADSRQTVHLRYMERGERQGSMKQVMLHLVTAGMDDDQRRTAMVVLARRGDLIPRRDLDAIDLDLRDGEVHFFDRYNPGDYTLLRFERMQKRFHLDVDKATERVPPDALRFAQLREEIARLGPGVAEALASDGPRPGWLKARIERYHLLTTEFWTRLSMPLACLAFVMIGVPLGVLGRTSTRAMGIAFAFGLIFLYYILLKWGTSLGQEGSPLAAAAIFSPNALLLLVGFLLGWRTIRQ